MELIYTKWLDLNIVHEYFANEHPITSLVPVEETRLILKENNIVVRKSAGGFVFYVGSESVDMESSSILKNLGMLKFEMISDDPLFYNYTDLSFLDSRDYYLFRNVPDSSMIQVVRAAFEDPNKHLKNDSLGILQINVDDVQTESLTLSFGTQKVFYEYQIIIPMNRNWEIIDLKVSGSEHSAYSGPIEKSLSTGVKTHAFTSPHPMSLQQTLTIHPELKLHYKEGSSTIKELAMKLPNPRPDQLSPSDDGQLVSSVIVYI